MDAKQIKEILNVRAEEVCRHLIPAGRRERSEWVCGDVHGTAGQSLRIHLEGGKVGVWADFADKLKGGSLLDLWMQVRNCDFKQAITEAKDWLGVKDKQDWRRATASPPPRQSPPSLAAELVPVVEGSPAWKWLTDVRKIKPESIREFKIGAKRFMFEGAERDFVIFPSFTPDGKLVRLKFRDIADKKRMFIKPKKRDGGFDLLFGWQAVAPDAQELTISEGELDALAMHSYGIPAVSLPLGAQPTKAAQAGAEQRSPHDEWLEKDFDRLQDFVSVRLALDSDKPGQDATRILVPRLGRMRCSVVQWPEKIKDADDARMTGMADTDFCNIIRAAKSCDPDELKLPSTFKADVWDLWHPTDSKHVGVPLPWAMPFLVRPGEVTIWQGFTKHGKTTCLSHCLTHWAARHEHKALIASFEIPGANTIENILRQASCKRMCDTLEELERRLRWMDEHFLIYDYVGDCRTPDVMEIFEYAARKYGIQHVVLDSLMKIVDVEGDDFSGQRALLNTLGKLADEFNLHVHLVAHSKKPDSKHPEVDHWPGIYDVMGSSYLVNLADNIVCVWRNKKKTLIIQACEQEIRNMEGHRNRDESKLLELRAKLDVALMQHDSLFAVQGQRKTGDTPTKNLFFDAGLDGSWQFRDERQAAPTVYLD